MGAPSLLERLAEMERRLQALERGVGTGLSGTDQTIKASHDRLDALLGAGNAAPDGTLVSNLNADQVDGLDAAESGADGHVLATDASGNAQLDGQLWQPVTRGGVIRAVFRKQVTDETAVDVFRITTPSSPPNNTGGAYSCYIHALADNQDEWSANGAGMGITAHFVRAIDALVGSEVGTCSAVVEDTVTASAPSQYAVTADIDDVSISVSENSEHEVDVAFTVDTSGTSPGTPYITVMVELVWSMFRAAPTITAL
jgi:hypothetical protein